MMKKHHDHDFNSIKVQLKRLARNVVAIAPTFQFHKGTIKTKLGAYGGKGLGLFQFHKGTIKTNHQKTFCHLLLNFNSIKVQLKPLPLSAYKRAAIISIP